MTCIHGAYIRTGVLKANSLFHILSFVRLHSSGGGNDEEEAHYVWQIFRGPGLEWAALCHIVS